MEQERPSTRHTERQGQSNIRRSPKLALTASNPILPFHTRFQESHCGHLLAHQASLQVEGGNGNTSSGGHNRGAPQDKDLPVQTNQVRQVSINLTSGHSKHHPVEAAESSEIPLFDQQQKPSPKRDKERSALSNPRRKMESSGSREHVTEDRERPHRVPTMLGF